MRTCKEVRRLIIFTLQTLISLLHLRSARRAMIVDLALSVTGSQLIASALPNVSTLTLTRAATSLSPITG